MIEIILKKKKLVFQLNSFSGSIRVRALSLLADSEAADLLHVLSQINDSVAVAPFVIIPTDDFMEVVIESNSSLGVED